MQLGGGRRARAAERRPRVVADVDEPEREAHRGRRVARSVARGRGDRAVRRVDLALLGRPAAPAHRREQRGEGRARRGALALEVAVARQQRPHLVVAEGGEHGAAGRRPHRRQPHADARHRHGGAPALAAPRVGDVAAGQHREVARGGDGRGRDEPVEDRLREPLEPRRRSHARADLLHAGRRPPCAELGVVHEEALIAHDLQQLVRARPRQAELPRDRRGPHRARLLGQQRQHAQRAPRRRHPRHPHANPPCSARHRGVVTTRRPAKAAPACRDHPDAREPSGV